MSQEVNDATQAVVTRAEIETLVTDYFEGELRPLIAVWVGCGTTQSPRRELYYWRRINDFIEAGAISEEKVIELRDKFLGEFDCPEAVGKMWQQSQRIQRELEELGERLRKEGSTILTVHSPGSNPIVHVKFGRKRSRDPHSQQVEGE